MFMSSPSRLLHPKYQHIDCTRTGIWKAGRRSCRLGRKTFHCEGPFRSTGHHRELAGICYLVVKSVEGNALEFEKHTKVASRLSEPCSSRHEHLISVDACCSQWISVGRETALLPFRSSPYIR